MSISEAFTQHFGFDSAKADEMEEWFCSSAFGNPTPFFARSRDVESIETVEQAIKTINRFLRDGSDEAQEIFRQEILRLDIKQRANSSASVGDSWKPPTHDGWIATRDQLETWEAAASAAISHIKQSKMAVRAKGRVNAEAIIIVDRARLAWNEWSATPAPQKELNEATKFGRYLADILHACGCEADPRSAFRAWARHMGTGVHTEGEIT